MKRHTDNRQPTIPPMSPTGAGSMGKRLATAVVLGVVAVILLSGSEWSRAIGATPVGDASPQSQPTAPGMTTSFDPQAYVGKWQGILTGGTRDAGMITIRLSVLAINGAHAEVVYSQGGASGFRRPSCWTRTWTVLPDGRLELLTTREAFSLERSEDASTLKYKNIIGLWIGHSILTRIADHEETCVR